MQKTACSLGDGLHAKTLQSSYTRKLHRHAGRCVQGRVASVDNQHYDHAASHLGKAVGVTNLLRGTAFHAARYALDFAKKCFSVC